MSTSSPPTPTPSERHHQAFSEDLLTWYEREKRDLPWRQTDDPYRIWVSEVMLQQTRVDQAIPYYHRFLESFPSLEALAQADLDAVLQQWEGLGYYSRARNLHDAAQQVLREHGGQIPQTKETIEELPGIGPYTSAAVLSIAFDEPHAVVDGNVSRVLSRVFALDADIKKYATKKLLRDLANQLLAEDEPEKYNQAIMELGATICTPNKPRCGECPISQVCEAYTTNSQQAFPVKGARKAIPHYNIAIGLIRNDRQELLIAKRPEDAMLGGLWEFPGGKQEDSEALYNTCARELQEELNIDVTVGPLFHTLDHAYSHFKITLHAFPCRITEGTPDPANGMPVRWVTLDDLSDYAFPRANRRIIEKLQKEISEQDLFEQEHGR